MKLIRDRSLASSGRMKFLMEGPFHFPILFFSSFSLILLWLLKFERDLFLFVRYDISEALKRRNKF